MSDIRFVFAGENTELQHDSVAMLARCFDEWRMFQTACGNIFPFREISFVALAENDKIAGHVGIMPFDVWDGKGKIIHMAGIASVGTDPDYRGRGIAVKLCNNAAEWAEKNGFEYLPLYTSFNRVYESCGWSNYPVRSLSLVNRNAKVKAGRKGAELTAAEKEFIIDCYNRIPEFPGKVIRGSDNSFHGWNRIFRETFFDWYITSEGYAVTFEGFLAEFFVLDGNASEIVSGIERAFLPENYHNIDSLLADGWEREGGMKNPECWHGENVMQRSIYGNIPANLFFSLTDKF